MPSTVQQRRRSYNSLDIFVRVLGQSLCSRGPWPIDLVEKMGLRPPWYLFRNHGRGTLWYGL